MLQLTVFNKNLNAAAMPWLNDEKYVVGSSCCVILQKALPWFMLYLALVLLARLNQCIELVLLQGMDLSIAGFYQCMLCTASSSCGLTLLI